MVVGVHKSSDVAQARLDAADFLLWITWYLFVQKQKKTQMRKVQKKRSCGNCSPSGKVTSIQINTFGVTSPSAERREEGPVRTLCVWTKWSLHRGRAIRAAGPWEIDPQLPGGWISRHPVSVRTQGTKCRGCMESRRTTQRRSSWLEVNHDGIFVVTWNLG